jgi:cytochrome P450
MATAERVVPSSDFDLFGREAIRDPQRYDGMLREIGPVVYMTAYDVWVTGRHEQVQLMMRDWETFSSTRPAFAKTERSILLSEDPPEHTRVRNVIQRAMSPAVLRSLQDQFTSEAEKLVDQLVADGPAEIDAHSELAKAYVLRVFPDALGLGEEGRENLVRFGHAMFNAFGPENEIFHESMAEASEVFAWVAEHCRREAVAGNGGIAAKMFEAADAGEITSHEAELLVRTLYSAGSDTTIFLIGNTLRALAEHPDEWERLRHDPGLARQAFEEGIRYDNPARYTRRTTNREVVVDGVPLPADARILLLHMPTGRDPRRWEHPDRYDLTRDVIGKHLGLGFGVHACVGGPVARLEGISILGALARRVSRLEVCGEPETTENMAVHGHEKLPLRLIPAPVA